MPIPTTEEDKTDNVSNTKPEFGLSGRRIIYDKDGKPYVQLLDFQFATGKTKPAKLAMQSASENVTATPHSKLKYAKEEPPDVAQLGKSSWTLLHSIAATFPETPNTKQQQDMKSFLNLFAGFYPCWYCGEDFVRYMNKHEPQTKSQDDLGKWLCEAHNDVNKKLGKPQFDCQFWKQRWKDGWDE
ncbi:Mitochondrial FAD-linked sulfhydryl oxidase ERV1 [Candida parapsilosis]|nr:Mitochondrial FAD-linked sulfhydryl oxidase ERV1 [Candida parapsilosis]KAI5906876.1 Mitochondrial FAD-linked sulfhydryl oxidase ERV1 [Candida parapsilosis]